MLENLKSLRNDMEQSGWSITSFIFPFKNASYIVLVKRFVGKEKPKSKYALVKLEFMNKNDLNDVLSVEANRKYLLGDIKVIRKYFGIKYSDNIGDAMKWFYNSLGTYIPFKVNNEFSDSEIKVMIQSLSNSDSEDPNKIYCIGVRRNPIGQKRSAFNSDKTKLLRKSLFSYFENDISISFCYSQNKNEEKNDKEILVNFAN